MIPAFRKLSSSEVACRKTRGRFLCLDSMNTSLVKCTGDVFFYYASSSFSCENIKGENNDNLIKKGNKYSFLN
jgi:hypothetical protein